jgi:hypothetical protein
MHLARDIVQLHQIGIADGPAVDRCFQITEMAEIEVQPDQARNVIGMVATLENPPRRLQIRRLTIQRQTQLVTALRHRNRVLVLEEDRLVAAVGIQVQVIDGVLLALGPETFTGDIAAHGRQDVETHAPNNA